MLFLTCQQKKKSCKCLVCQLKNKWVLILLLPLLTSWFGRSHIQVCSVHHMATSVCRECTYRSKVVCCLSPRFTFSTSSWGWLLLSQSCFFALRWVMVCSSRVVLATDDFGSVSVQVSTIRPPPSFWTAGGWSWSCGKHTLHHPHLFALLARRQEAGTDFHNKSDLSVTERLNGLSKRSRWRRTLGWRQILGPNSSIGSES